jgi:hypothetical protein
MNTVRRALALLPVFSVFAAVHAGTMENFDNFGKQDQNTIPCPASPNGICAAASTLNSFIFLANQYPLVYGNMLDPSVTGTIPDQTDPTDTLNFANFYYGYLVKQPNAHPFDAFRYALTTWMTDFAFGTSVVTSIYPGSPDNNGLPTTAFLTSEIMDQEDVQVFVYGTVNGSTVGHAINLIGISSSNGDYVIQYQDPNSPKDIQTSELLFGPGGQLMIQGLPGTGPPYLTTIFSINAAYAESPIPEPASWVLVGSSIVLLGGLRMRWNRTPARNLQPPSKTCSPAVSAGGLSG